MEDKYLLPALDLVETVFTDSECAENGKLVRSLVEEIRSKRFYEPKLELIMVDSDTDEVIGYVNFARFHLDGKYENELLLLSPVLRRLMGTYDSLRIGQA
jgi:predicted N-acetyltransferase YhbS